MGDWLFYRAYVPDLGGVRDLVENVVLPSIAEFKAANPGLRWFFLQYIDVLGLHLRLRLYGDHDQLAAYEDVLDTRLAERSAPVLKRLYEPEYDKYGAEGVTFAERIFQLGSEAALACAGPRHRSAPALYGAAHTDLVVAGLPASVQISFLHQYAWYWSGRGLRTAIWPVPAAARASAKDPAAYERAARLRAQIGKVLADEHVANVLTGYARDFWALLAAPERPTVRTDFTMAFHHLHLMNNRLGVSPGEEAQIARLLWLDRLGRGGHDSCHASAPAQSHAQEMTQHSICGSPAVRKVAV